MRVYVRVFAHARVLCSSENICLFLLSYPQSVPAEGSQEAHFTDQEAESWEGFSVKLRLQKGRKGVSWDPEGFQRGV